MLIMLWPGSDPTARSVYWSRWPAGWSEMRKAGSVAMLALAGCHQTNEVPQPAPREPAPSAIEAPVLPAPAPPSAQPTPSPAPTPSPSPTPVPQKHVQALGTEPFWSVEVLPGKLRYSSPEQLSKESYS